ncbi:RDD family protein [Wolbachia endosymbiont of Folsomia candida]|uniref:RDD family protein n=1 Tax=Wolbachia endosymbiont of Folsomia candida TaxID=169402 RepID=UPI000A52D500|nr:RDD family protein [Wolbachia endosymbiont of Folsomia candida]APR99068.1 hypothetical protein ASM33_07770 [Wolbachia endosymbiont of Folsomia candida]
MDIKVNYVGITRRAIAYVIDHFIIRGILLIFFCFIKMTFDHVKSELLIICIYVCLFFLISVVFEVFMIRRLNYTPGQFLCLIRIKDANTLKNVTLVQAIIRYVSFEAIRSSIFITSRFPVKYASEWWFQSLSILSIMVIILIFISAMLDRRKQFFHDKIAGTVAINYKPSS